MQPIRIWYKKTGNAIYISHLDMNRVMLRALKRAHVPAWITEGFNPHIYVTFPLPLSLGTEGDMEPMDLKLMEDIPLSKIKDDMNAVMPVGIEILDVTIPEHKVSDIGYAKYEASINDENIDDAFFEKIKEYMQGDNIPLVKKTKSKELEINAKDFMTNLNINKNGNNIEFSVVLPVGQSSSLNPQLIIEKLISEFDFADPLYKIRRIKIYTLQMTSFK